MQQQARAVGSPPATPLPAPAVEIEPPHPPVAETITR
jgi:hypothetical protein